MNDLALVLQAIHEEYAPIIDPDSGCVTCLGISGLMRVQAKNPGPRYNDAYIVIPVTTPLGSMSTVQPQNLFAGYIPRQLWNGIILPSWIAEAYGGSHRAYSKNILLSVYTQVRLPIRRNSPWT